MVILFKKSAEKIGGFIVLYGFSAGIFVKITKDLFTSANFCGKIKYIKPEERVYICKNF